MSFILIFIAYMKVFKTLLVLSIILIFTTGCTDVDNKTNIKATPTKTISETLGGFEPSKTNQTVILETTMGNITIELFNEDMPITAGNFEKLVKDGFYDGIIFHRVIPDFMAQGGDPTGTGMGGSDNIPDENVGLHSNVTGTISMANAGPNTGSSQFFLNVADNTFLDTKHPVFGQITEGLDVVQKIVLVERDASDKPLTDVVIKKAYIK